MLTCVEGAREAAMASVTRTRVAGLGSILTVFYITEMSTPTL